MNYIMPSNDTYTIYTKSSCPFCVKAKEFLKNETPEPLIVNCDEYLVENKASFLSFLKLLTIIEYKTFPLIFFKGIFIGGYTDIVKHYEKTNAFLENLEF